MKNCKTYIANRACSNDYYQHFRNHLLSYDHIQFLIFFQRLNFFEFIVWTTLTMNMKS